MIHPEYYSLLLEYFEATYQLVSISVGLASLCPRVCVNRTRTNVFYDHASKTSGERFKALLAKYYPWDLEPPGGADATTGPHLLYKAFRNPLAHELGILDKTIGGSWYGRIIVSGR